MLIRYGYDLTVSCSQPTPTVMLLSLREERLPDLQAPEVFEVQPPVEMSTYRDLFGNRCRRFVAPAGDLTLREEGVIAAREVPEGEDRKARETPVAELPDDTLMYLLPSRYCEADLLSQVAWDLFGQTAPGWERVQSISEYVHQHIRFGFMDADVYRTAVGAWQGRIGVCRDFAHLGIALCRALNIPARYVSGYVEEEGLKIQDPMDFGAWMEVWLDGSWRTFDPRNNRPRIGRIPVAWGRDAADTPLLHSFGPHLLKSFRVWAKEVANSVA